MESPVKGDWVPMVADDMKALGLEIDLEQLQYILKTTFIEMVKIKLQQRNKRESCCGWAGGWNPSITSTSELFKLELVN